ncbi:gliding motility-associated ABC transporter ATP-binding subunit GldA [Flavilitoribacter nigricans]|uniref:Gliding motility-associated ABC transporter ATP-binding subunit GldA n=1 Tax=Flavilitoribacter nigricans (strain ATCC 23147 / DSM 23189 / NBRC 102662 / NCIMB 1420 / SS-2) TaxID=1122177 RepID=A0A2D0NL08_FLAN2|nr:gliding motility-associated ABC transporter ATP-binding subunit GldA [Flavilitoribacter nigricans]PHN08423.1 gliding motility-associated ABC transporter ATP-binding subunit GldA [Flavilitoribacter nigricans DSM 23189 = NBRC 102662]
MSVTVTNLTKQYGSQLAVNDLSFEAKRGEILGFLGPNGAGKTTTMKIITSYIPQTSGTVSVCGHDVTAEPMEVRRNIGYLPEHNPLYKEMYVREYLHFIAGVHKIANPSQRIEEMIEMTGLGREQNKLIGTLSKGYRQRVGLAQAMLHDPEVLILDEPTSGLDPNQLVDIRALIKRIGEEKTVIFSTHIMQEVQAICDRVLIINRGQLVANDPIDRLQSRLEGEVLVTVEFKQKVDQKRLLGIDGVKAVKQLGKRWQLTSDKDRDIREAVFAFAVANQLSLLELHKEEVSVEDVFRRLTAN